MRIGILGAGRLGGTLARLFGEAGHEVVVANSRGRDAVAPIVEGWPNVSPGDRQDVVGTDVVVLAFPWRVAEQALADLDLSGHVVVDATNPFSEDFEIVETGPAGSTGTVAALLPGARIVKGFNTVPDERLIEDARERAPTPRRIGLPVAADDVDARDEVADLMGDIGFTAVPVGGLADGHALMEPASPLFNVPLPAHELEERLHQLRD